MTLKSFVNGRLVELSPEAEQEFRAEQIAPEEVMLRHRASTIKEAAAKRILAIAPLHTQQNLSAHRIGLMVKRAEGELPSADDIALEHQAAEVARRIAAIRAAGKAAIEAGISVDAVVWPEKDE